MASLVTDSVIINSILFLVGLYVLTKSSDKFVDAATVIAEHFHVSDIVIGLTLVSIGTSLPELATNIYSAATGSCEVAIGNALGSNITNILLALGAVLLFKSLPVGRKVFYRDGLGMGSTFILFALFAYLGDPVIERWHGIVFLIITIGYLYYLIAHSSSDKNINTRIVHTSGNLRLALFWIAASIVLITLGAKLMVDNIVWVAVKFEIPKSIISATIIAIGTSLPEVAVTISGVKKCKPDIVLGNIIGSCIFNIILVMGVTATIMPVPIDHEVAYYLLPIMLFTGFLCLLFMRMGWKLKRWHGVVFLVVYLTYLVDNVFKILK
jgi:cation:H+ antiporter